MTFLYPWALLFLCVPVLLFWTVIGRRPGVVMPFDHQSHGSRGRWLRWGLGMAIVMLARPQMLKQPRAERLLTNVQICMDVSGSMSGGRYRMASKAITDFTTAREGDAFGLTLFGSHQIRWIPLTKDLKAIRNAMPFADPERQPIHMSGTAIVPRSAFASRTWRPKHSKAIAWSCWCPMETVRT
jgi:Ca-activated chloride channel homolog